MRFLAAAHTDVGIIKKINQDAFGLKIARTSNNSIAFAILCDGMGGLNDGEYASALVVNAFSKWFEDELPLEAKKSISLKKVANRWCEIVGDIGKKILEYGYDKNLTLGTTLTAILIVDDKYVNIHVGDSRLYQVNDALHQITKDQTVAAYEIAHKRMTEEQARNDRRSSILLQCVGASKVITPELNYGTLKENDLFMLCSDGFRHKVYENEMYEKLAPDLLTDEKAMEEALVGLVELNKSRKERDNITTVLIKAIP